MLHQTQGRFCYAGWHLDSMGVAYDFQGRCDPGQLPSQVSNRRCEVPYYAHEGSTGIYYDVKGYCDPTYTLIPGIKPSILGTTSSSWVWYLAGGVGVYLIWKNRKRIF